MSAVAIAKKDFRDAVRSRGLIATTVLFVLFAVGGAYASVYIGGLLGTGGDQQTTLDLIFALQTPAGFLVPIIALLIGYGAVSGERESGSLKFLLGLPHTRRDVVLGKVLGRTAVVTVSILIGFAVGIAAIFAFTGSFSPVEYVAFTLLTILLGFVFVCIGVGISAMTGSTTRSAIGAFGLLAVFWLLWPILGTVLLYFITGTPVPQIPVPDWYLLYNSVLPGSGYDSAITAVLGGTPGLASLTDGELPVFARPWFGFVLLALWVAVPLLIGSTRFERVDL